MHRKSTKKIKDVVIFYFLPVVDIKQGHLKRF